MIIAIARKLQAGGRGVLFTIVAGLAALLALVPAGGIPAALSAWMLLSGAPGIQNTELDRWHEVQWGALVGILVGAGAQL